MFKNLTENVKSFKVGFIEFDDSRPDWCFASLLEVLLALPPGHLRNSRVAVSERIHPEDIAHFWRCVDERNPESVCELELRLRNANDQYRWFRFNFQACQDFDEHANSWSVAVVDIDDLKQSQLQNLSLIDRRDQFIAVLSHELRNPLIAIRHSLDVLYDRQPEASSDSQREYLDIINRQTQQLSRILDDLQDVTRCTQDRIEFRRTVHDVNSSVREIVHGMWAIFMDKQQSISLELSAQPLLVGGDVERIKQVLTNLLQNANRYTDPGGMILVSTLFTEERAVIQVRDSGMGVCPDDLQQIFELFYRSEQARTTNTMGLGVGLYLVKQIVEKLGGQICVASQGLGMGSEFTVELPLVLEHREADLDEPKPATFQNLTVCLVEDIADTRLALRTLFEHRGCKVFEFADSESAVAGIPEIRPDVAVIDIGLPGMNGLELAEHLRRREKMTDVMLIALTGFGQRADLDIILKSGFDKHLVKPAGINDLWRMIAEYRQNRTSR